MCDNSGNCQLSDFLSNVQHNMVKYRDRLLVIFRQTSQEGPQLFNDRISHQIDKNNEIWEFRSGRFRVLWFYDEGKLIVCTGVFLKQTNTTPKIQKERAISLRKKYFHDKKNGDIEYGD